MLFCTMVNSVCVSVHLSGHVYFCRINPERGRKRHCFRLALHSLAVQVHTYPRSRGMLRSHFLQRQTLLSGENPPRPQAPAPPGSAPPLAQARGDTAGAVTCL